MITSNPKEFLGDINDFSTRKLIYICDTYKIPKPLNNSRDELIIAIKKFYSEKPNYETPNGKTANKENFAVFETPKIPMTHETTASDAQPTPIYVNRSLPSQMHSRSPSPHQTQTGVSPIINALANQMQRESLMKRNRSSLPMLVLVILFVFMVILLIILIF